jgi:hypothetical protein
MERLLQRFQRQYGWTPNYRLVFKKPAPQGPNFQVPQTNGLPGWIIFTYDNSIPVCAWISAQECHVLPCIIDERICGDTFLKVERTSKNEFVISDVWMYNSNCIFAGSTFKQRYGWLEKFIPMIHKSSSATLTLLHKSKLTSQKIRGYEEYTDEIGSTGFFTEKHQNSNSNIVKIKKLSLPDCYEVMNDKGYLLVPNLKTSEYLRSLGSEFSMPCILNGDGSWSLLEPIH